MQQLLRCQHLPRPHQVPLRAVLRKGGARLRALATQAGTDRTKNAEEFEQWFRKHSATLPVDLGPASESTTSRGYGMISRAPVADGDLLLQVPKSLFITEDTARSSSLCGRLVTKKGLEEWQALVLQLLCERAAGQSSKWAPYIKLLGPQASHPLLWSKEQQAWLNGSPMQQKLEDRLQQIKEDTSLLIEHGANDLEVAKQWQQQHQQPLVTEASVAWAAAVLLSRAFSLDMSEPELSLEADMSYYGSWQTHQPDVLALVPWADLLAHSSEAGEDSVLQYNAEDGCAELYAHRSYSPGEEVFDSYGVGLSPCDLLLDYGFVDPGNDNLRYEACPSEVLQPTGARQRALLGALEQVQGGPGATIALGPLGPDLTSLTWLRAAASTDAELVRAGWRVKATEKDVEMACRAMGRLSLSSSKGTEEKVLAALLAFISRALAAYPSSLQQDEQELASLQPTSSSSSSTSPSGGSETSSGASSETSSQQQVRVQVLRALISEKKALVGSQRVVEGWLHEVKEGRNLEDVYVGIVGGPEKGDSWDS